MSWKEFKKKKEQEYANTANNSIKTNISTNMTNSNSSQMSSWQKFKQEKEINNNNSKSSSWQKYKNNKENQSRKLYNDEENTWFKGSKLFDDGYQFGDISGTVLGTIGDAGVNVVKGVADIGEGIGDAISYGIADIYDWNGNDTRADEIRARTKKNVIDSVFEPAENYLDKNSVLGEKSDSIAEGLGYVAGITAVGYFTGGVGVTATTFTNGMANGMSEALNNGASISEARMYGAISGAGEAISELAFGGLGKASQAMGLSKGALDDVVIGGLTKNIKNKMVKTLMQSGLKATGEGLEEVVSGLISAAGKRFTYMDDKKYSEIVKDENLAEQFWMGALTSAISQGPSTIKSIKTGTDYISGKTDNEQKVYDNEVKTRTNEKVKQATIEQAYNEQIKSQENLGIEITENLKKEIMQKVEKAYDNGTLKTTELSKKDLMKIEEQVENDMQEGNISVDNIKQILGENQDISRDKLLMKSMYENEQKYISYKMEQTDNEKVNILMQSAADAGMNNTSKTRKKVELISKLVKDTDRQYKFVSPEQLKQMGYNENANGLINKSTGEILINAHTEKGIESIVGHETTHIFDSKDKDGNYSKEYQTLQDLAIEYAKTKGIYDSKVQSITEAYGDLLVDEAQIREELTADLVGDFLFNDEQFIENLAVKDRNVFQKIYDYIKHTYKILKGTDEEKAFENLKKQFEKVYKTVSIETDTDTKYSIGGKEGMKNAIKEDTGYLKLERDYNKAQQMQKNGTDNETIRKATGWFQDKNGDWKFEFSDKDMSLKNIKFLEGKTYKLGNILKHDILFTIYPELANYNVSFKEMKQGGLHNRENNSIKINSNKINSNLAIESTLIHEIQHAIQKIENFEKGGSSKGSKLAYYNKLGEIEADDTKQRYLKEKNSNFDRNIIAPESSKVNPKHSKFDNYLKNRTIIDKIKDGLYNYINNKIGRDINNEEFLEEDYQTYENENIQNQNEDFGLVVGRGYINENISENQEIDTQDVSKNNGLVLGGINKIHTTSLSSVSTNKSSSTDFINNSIPSSKKDVNTTTKYSMQESENNSGSFNLSKEKQERLKELKAIDTSNMGFLERSKINQEIRAIENGFDTVEDYIKSEKEKREIASKEAEKEREERLKKIAEQEKEHEGYQMTHRPTESGAYASNISDNGFVPKDVYEHPEWYFDMNRDFTKESFDIIKKIKGNPEAEITIYRATPSNTINKGDWVTLSKKYAEYHKESNLNGKGNIVELKVKAKDVQYAGDDINEFGYFPQDEKYSLTNDNYITGDDIAVKDMLVQQRPTIENEVGNTQKTILEENVEKNEQENVNDQKSSFKELQDKYKLMEIGKRQYEKLLRKEKPTEKEKITVDRLIKGEIENNEIPASVNRQRVVDLYNAKVKFYSVEQEIKAQRKAITKSYRDLAKNMIKNISTWKDKKMGIQYQVNTMKRNLRDIIPDKSEADSLYNEYFKPITKNNATIEKEISKYNDRISKYEINNVESQYIQMIGENKYNPDTKLPLEKIEEFYDKHKSKIDINKCQEAVEEFRNIYDELIVKINDVLIENGYKPIEYRKGYFPHFVENKASTILGKFAEKLGWKINADTLPTDIAGITDQFKPGKAWTAFSQQRKGDETDYNALKGFDNYIRGAMDVIHHTKDIQKLRALENEIRYQYSEKGIQEQIDNIYDDHESSIEEKQQKINEIFENTKNNPMGFLATELRDYTNNLANKKATADRGLEHSAGRQTYSIMTNIQNRVSANMVGANISSAITNFIPITQAWSQTSTKNMMKAIKESVAIQFKDDGFSNESTFLTNRTKQADRLYKTGLDKANDKLGYMFDIVDSFTSNVIVRAKYYDNIDSGMNTQDALDNADEFAKDVIAGRSKGDMPTIFNQKNPLAKLFTAFQLEVNNQYGYMLKDLPADLGDEAKEKLVGAFVKMFLGAFLYNMISEKITGNKSAFSPIDIALDSYNTLSNDEISTGDKIKTIGTDLLGETPFLGGIAGGGRLPIQGAIPYDDPFSMVLETISSASDVFDGNEEQKQTAIKSLTKEWSKPLYYVALPFAGGQLKKSIEGTSMYLNDVPGSYTNSGDLRFTVDDDIGSKVKATIFGTYSNPYAQDYIDSGFKTISKDNIDEMVGLDMNSTEYREYKKGLSESNKTEEKLNYINSLDLTDSQKTLAANNINKNSKKTIDMSEYGNYSSYDEYKYARDNPKKYSVVTQITDYGSYVKYKDDIADIKKKYSTEAGYESKERRIVVQNYINSLDLNQYQKMMLEKLAGGYSIKNYQNYIYEYLETTDLTSGEKYTIWEELFE